MNLTTANSVTVKQLRDGLHSVFIMGLTEGSSARKIAEQAAGATNSYLRGKEVFGRAFEDLVALPDSNSGGQLRLKSTNGVPTPAGGIVAAWQKVSADRATLFDGLVLPGQVFSRSRSTGSILRRSGKRTRTRTHAS